MAPKDIACRACAAQPGEYCSKWQDLRGIVLIPGFIHSERIIDAASHGDGSPVQFTAAQVDHAILKTNLI